MPINQMPTEEVELEYAETTTLVNKYKALERLKTNEDFKLLVLDGYLKENAIRLTSLLANEYTKHTGTRGHIMEELVAISTFEDHLRTIENLGAAVAADDAEE